MSEEKTKKETKTPDEKPVSNIIFVGKRQKLNKETGKPELAAIDAPSFINDGEDKISLPDSDIQKKGFCHEEAARIISLFPNDYKELVAKGK